MMLSSETVGDGLGCGIRPGRLSLLHHRGLLIFCDRNTNPDIFIFHKPGVAVKS